MGIATGKPRGRPKGSLNKSSEKLQQALAEKAVAVEATLDEPFASDSHDLLMSIYNDLTQPLAIRMEAAKASLPYEKPRLASTDLRATPSAPTRTPCSSGWGRKTTFQSSQL